MFGRRRSFDEQNVKATPRGSGIYIIYRRNSFAVYVGRSSRDIRYRLLCHLRCRGSRMIVRPNRRLAVAPFSGLKKSKRSCRTRVALYCQ